MSLKPFFTSFLANFNRNANTFVNAFDYMQGGQGKYWPPAIWGVLFFKWWYFVNELNYSP